MYGELPYQFVALKASFKPIGITKVVLLKLLTGSRYLSKIKNIIIKIIFIIYYSIIKTSFRYIHSSAVFIFMIHYLLMTDPILFISMILGLGGVFVLINSFSDDDDSDNDGGMGTYIYNLEPVKVVNN